MLYLTEEALLYKAKQAENMTFGQIDNTGRLKNKKAKGQLGQVIEESFFGYEINSKSEADFLTLEIELKVTPIKENKNGTLSAKERLVLNIINFHDEVKKDFYSSSFWNKNKNLLIIVYLWEPDIPRADYRIIKSFFHKLSQEDYEIIKQDWKAIVRKIREGRAHELSEADTIYLGACTKGASKKSVRTQPFSDVPAMQRAFSLKQSYMTALIRKEIDSDYLKQFTTENELANKSFLHIIEDKFRPYKNMSIKEIATENKLTINSQSKAFLQQFISGLLGIKGTRLNEIEEFAKANIQFKTIRLEPNATPREHMSFNNIDFLEWTKTGWEYSWLKNYFEETKFLFVVFFYKESHAENPNRELFFKGVKLWNMPKKAIDENLYKFWQETTLLLKEGVTLTPIKQKNRVIIKNNLPKPNSNGICHIRPKARDGSDVTPLPDGRNITKQAFWFDRNYIKSLISDI